LETFFGGQSLVPHPDNPPREIPNVTVTYVSRGGGNWGFDFIVAAPPTALRLPEAAQPQRADGLWEHTCFELFLLDPASGAYLEFNFSPSGQWAAYRFDGYRAGRRDLDVAPPRILTSDPAQFALGMRAHLRKIGLDDGSIDTMFEVQPLVPPGPHPCFTLHALFEGGDVPSAAPWLAGLSAIIEEADGTKSYWALAHPPGAPDFHHPDCFILELPPAGGE
jgi:hypothetical protein